MNTRLRIAAIIIRNGRIIFVEHRDHGGNYLSLPGGGVEPGENLEAAVRREIKEEIGLAVEPIKLVHVRQFSISPNAPQVFEAFFVAEIIGKSKRSRTSHEREALGEVVELPIDGLHASPLPILPEEFRDSEWLRAKLSSPGISCSCAFGEVPSGNKGQDVIPEDLKKAMPAYFRKGAVVLQADSSYSNMGPLLARDSQNNAIVLRQYLPQHARWTLNAIKVLNTSAKKRFGQEVWTRLRGRSETEPWHSSKDRAILVQDYSPTHDPRMLFGIRDYDVLALGRQCGEIMKLTGECGPTDVPDQIEAHPLAMPIAQRLAVVEQVIDSDLPHLEDLDFRNLLISEARDTIHRLRSLGAGGFPVRLVDRDLNIENATLCVNAAGVKAISSIFDPDFCRGSIADALRNPARSFASELPRLSLEDILRNDLRTVGSPRWRLFIEGFLETCSLSREEILAIPLFEKLEIIIYRLFENTPRYALPAEYRSRFREVAVKQLRHFNQIISDGILRSSLKGEKPLCFSSGNEEKANPLRFAKAIEQLRLRPSIVQQVEERGVVELHGGYMVASAPESEKPKRNTIILQDGYPFPVARSLYRAHPPLAPHKRPIIIYRQGEALRKGQRGDMIGYLRLIRSDWSIKKHNVSSLELPRIVSSKIADGDIKAFILDPFRYLGDSSYIALYGAMLQFKNRLSETHVLTRNTSLWRVYDCAIAYDVSDLPESLDLAVLPAPIDDQWGSVLSLLEPLLERCDTIVFPQRDLILIQNRLRKTVALYHTDKQDTVLNGNIAAYTWWGLARMLQKPPALEEALRVFKPAFRGYGAREYALKRTATRVLLNPFSSSELKDLSPAFCSELARRLVAELGGDIVVWISGGSPANLRHKNAVRLIKKKVGLHCAAHIVETSLDNAICTMTSMDLIVTADTSISHLAAQKGIPTLVLWNTERWRRDNSVEMTHRGPAGFSTLSPWQFDVCFQKEANGKQRSLQRNADDFQQALRLWRKVNAHAGTPLDSKLWKNLATLVEKTRILQDAIYRVGGADIAGAEAGLSMVAGQARHAYRRLNKVFPELTYLERQQPPIDTRYLFKLLKKPSAAGFASRQACLEYTYGVWRGHVLCKLAHTFTCVQVHSHEIEAKFVLAENNREYGDSGLIKQFGGMKGIRARIAKEGLDVQQGYIPKSQFSKIIKEARLTPPFMPGEMRLRKFDGKNWLTAKGIGKLVRDESEVQVTDDFFNKHWPMTLKKRINKRRWRTTFGEYVLECDEYKDRDLLVAEVTLPNKEAYHALSKIGRDVTGDPLYRNHNLAR